MAIAAVDGSAASSIRATFVSGAARPDSSSTMRSSFAGCFRGRASIRARSTTSFATFARSTTIASTRMRPSSTRLQAAVAEGMKRFEFNLRRQAEMKGSEVFLSGADDVPEQYRKLVEQYDKSLSKGPEKPGDASKTDAPKKDERKE